MISKESHHKACNKLLAYMKKQIVLKHVFPKKPTKAQPEPKSKMIARVSHDDIKVWEPKT